MLHWLSCITFILNETSIYVFDSTVELLSPSNERPLSEKIFIPVRGGHTRISIYMRVVRRCVGYMLRINKIKRKTVVI